MRGAGGSWHDGLLLDLLTVELTPEPEWGSDILSPVELGRAGGRSKKQGAA